MKLSRDFIVSIDPEECPKDQKPLLVDFIEDYDFKKDEGGDLTGGSATKLRSTSGNDILDIDR